MRNLRGFRTVLVLILLLSGGAPGFAQSFSIYDEVPRPPGSIPRPGYEQVMRAPADNFPDDAEVFDQSVIGTPSAEEMPAQFRRQMVSYPSRDPAGTIVIDTPHTYLYYVLGGGQAIRYGIGVGREGFTWSGVRAIDRKTEWPDWIPPADMIDRQPDLPRWMAGGPGNPLGARAMYLGGTLYRIHGTNDPSTIGKRVSSGCIRMFNDDVVDLFNRAHVGTRVVVLADTGRRVAYDTSGARALPRGQRASAVPVDADAPEATYRPVRMFSPSSLY